MYGLFQIETLLFFWGFFLQFFKKLFYGPQYGDLTSIWYYIEYNELDF